MNVKKTKVKKATKKIKAKKAKISLKMIKGATGYEVKVSTGKKFKKKKTITKVFKKAKFTIKIKKFKNKKKLYVKARAFKVVKGIRYNGKWSRRKRIKMKKK